MLSKRQHNKATPSNPPCRSIHSTSEQSAPSRREPDTQRYLIELPSSRLFSSMQVKSPIPRRTPERRLSTRRRVSYSTTLKLVHTHYHITQQLMYLNLSAWCRSLRIEVCTRMPVGVIKQLNDLLEHSAIFIRGLVIQAWYVICYPDVVSDCDAFVFYDCRMSLSNVWLPWKAVLERSLRPADMLLNSWRSQPSPTPATTL